MYDFPYIYMVDMCLLASQLLRNLVLRKLQYLLCSFCCGMNLQTKFVTLENDSVMFICSPAYFVLIESQDSAGLLQAASLRIAEQYIQAFSKIAKEVIVDLHDI